MYAKCWSFNTDNCENKHVVVYPSPLYNNCRHTNEFELMLCMFTINLPPEIQLCVVVTCVFVEVISVPLQKKK